MAKIKRPNLNIEAFASKASGNNRTVFGIEEKSDDLEKNLTNDFFVGWEKVAITEKPPREWFNGYAFTISQLISYLYQHGLAEWSEKQEYHINSFVNFNGVLYKSLIDDNVGKNPATDTTSWSTLSQKLTWDDKTKYFRGDLVVLEIPINSNNWGIYVAVKENIGQKPKADPKDNDFWFKLLGDGVGVSDPTNDNSPVPKAWMENWVNDNIKINSLSKTNNFVKTEGSISLSGKCILTDLPAPTKDADATTKAYVDSHMTAGLDKLGGIQGISNEMMSHKKGIQDLQAEIDDIKKKL